ncbi:MAG: hypothetical protein K9M45_01730 [Kiritimatiellales bacterium]|nr:hypothetical protein [Kiritimatiellales bacterium]
MFKKLVGLLFVAAVALCVDAEPLAWMRFGEVGGQKYADTPYHFLGDSSLFLAIEVPLTGQPASLLDQWATGLQEEGLTAVDRARIHGLQANEALRRCRKYIDGWAPHCDPKTGLVPRNLNKSKDLWNGKDSAADNYAFMVLVSALTDRDLYHGRMLRILETEERVATLRNGLPVDYDFEKGAVKDGNQKLPIDYPRINQFPEWFAVKADGKYKVDAETVKGGELLDGFGWAGTMIGCE